MEGQVYPRLRSFKVMVDPAVTNDYKFTSKKPYLLLDLFAPEVSANGLRAVVRANTTNYEQAVQRYFAGNFSYDSNSIRQPENRIITYLNTLTNLVNEGQPYLLSITILEFA